jgi:hypothetical protein
MIVEDVVKAIEMFAPLLAENAAKRRVIFPMWLLSDEMQLPWFDGPLLDDLDGAPWTRLAIQRA